MAKRKAREFVVRSDMRCPFRHNELRGHTCNHPLSAFRAMQCDWRDCELLHGTVTIRRAEK